MSLQLENFDNKSFEELVEEAKKRIPVYAPGWTDFNIHDPGITLIELFAFLTENQIYRFNRVPYASYWNFLKLLDISPSGRPGDEDEIQAAVLKAREDMKTVHRAVTAGDYEILALTLDTPGINVVRAKALPMYHPNQHQEVPRVVTVVVVPDPEEDTANSDFLSAVYEHLKKSILLNTRLFVTLPLSVTVGVQAAVICQPEYLEDNIVTNVKEALAGFLDPSRGGPQGTGWPFGRPVYLSEIYEIIDQVQGVDHVETGSVWLKKEGDTRRKSDIFIPEHGLVESGNLKITAIVD